MEGKAEKNYPLYLINNMKLRCLAKGESGRHGTKTKGGGVSLCTVETATFGTSINHCSNKEDRG